MEEETELDGWRCVDSASRHVTSRHCHAMFDRPSMHSTRHPAAQ